MAALKALKSLISLAMHGGKINKGRCPVCEKRTFFIEEGPYLREHYRCFFCRSQPRNRALMHVLRTYYPEYRYLKIHESSPSGPSSKKIAAICLDYCPTQYFHDTPSGEYKNGVRCENLECMTFPDEHFDLVITQDVVEHIMNPERAFKDIARTLKPGGAHVFTVPIFSKKTLVRARKIDETVQFLETPDYHGNPVNEKRSLVVREWGEDILDFILEWSGMTTSVYTTYDRNFGLDGQFLDVLVSKKSK